MSDEKQTLSESITEHAVVDYHRQVDRLSTCIHDLANRIEEIGHRVSPQTMDNRDGHLDHSRAASRIVKEITVTLMNAPISNMLDSASVADRWIRNPYPQENSR